jgi:hypothetical protein
MSDFEISETIAEIDAASVGDQNQNAGQHEAGIRPSMDHRPRWRYFATA